MGRGPGGLLEQAIELGPGETRFTARASIPMVAPGSARNAGNGAPDPPVAGVAPGGGAKRLRRPPARGLNRSITAIIRPDSN